MKRDMDLVREILLDIERHSIVDEYEMAVVIEGRDSREVGYHLRLLVDAGLVDATQEHDSHDADYDDYCVRGLTWAGHDFLDAARTPRVWEQAKTTLREKALSVPFDLLKDLLRALARAELGAILS